MKDCCAVGGPVYAERLDPALIFLWLFSLQLVPPWRIKAKKVTTQKERVRETERERGNTDLRVENRVRKMMSFLKLLVRTQAGAGKALRLFAVKLL